MSAHVDTHALAVEIAKILDERTTPPLLDAPGAAELLAVLASWILAEARAGRIPHRRLGRYVRFDRDDLLGWCEARAVGPRTRKPT